MTGAPVPRGADAVLMLEHVEVINGQVRLLSPRTVEPGENVVANGAQARKGEELLAVGTRIGSAQIALAAACGCARVEVFPKPHVAILATGDELRSRPILARPRPDSQLQRADARRNGRSLRRRAVGLTHRADTKKPSTARFPGRRRRSAAHHRWRLSGQIRSRRTGLARGLARVFTSPRAHPARQADGVWRAPTHRRCGKNLIQSQNSAKHNQERTKCYFFGLPGNPVSSAVTFLLLAAPLLRALAGSCDIQPHFALAHLAGDVKAKPGLTRFLPAICTFNGETPSVALVSWQGSSDIAAMARANCFLAVPEDAERLKAGTVVRILLT